MGGYPFETQKIQPVSYAGKVKIKGSNAAQKRQAKRRNNIRIRCKK
jgi:hypothetical protein